MIGEVDTKVSSDTWVSPGNSDTESFKFIEPKFFTVKLRMNCGELDRLSVRNIPSFLETKFNSVLKQECTEVERFTFVPETSYWCGKNILARVNFGPIKHRGDGKGLETLLKQELNELIEFQAEVYSLTIVDVEQEEEE